MSLKAVSIGRQANRRIVCLSTRQFTPREAFECHPPVNENSIWTQQQINDGIQPCRDQKQRVHYTYSNAETESVEVAGSCYRTDSMYHHYYREIGWKEGVLHFSGYYGPYWTANFGMHYHFMKRRLPTAGVYESKNPFANMWNRFTDNRGIDWAWAHGQGHHIIMKWFLYMWFGIKAWEYKGILSNHRKLALPDDTVAKPLPAYNSAFYQYVVAEVENPPKMY